MVPLRSEIGDRRPETDEHTRDCGLIRGTQALSYTGAERRKHKGCRVARREPGKPSDVLVDPVGCDGLLWVAHLQAVGRELGGLEEPEAPERCNI